MTSLQREPIVLRFVELRKIVRGSAVCAFVAAGFLRYGHSAIIRALPAEAWTRMPDQLQPLIQLIWHGTPIRDSIPHLSQGLRYGPTLYLVAAPVVALTRSADVVHYVLLALAHVFFWAALYLMDRRLFASSHWTVRLLMVGVALNFTPALENLRGATLDLWELLAVVAAFYLFTSSSRRGPELAAIPVAASIMAKLMPMLLLLFLFMRRRATVWVSATTALLILIAGQLLFGWEMGFGFPKRALDSILVFGTKWAPLWWENDTPRGLVYKALTGFKLAPGVWLVQIDPGVRRVVDLVMGVLGFALLLFAVAKLWRWRGAENEQLRVLGGFATAIVLYHVISPYSTHQYLPSMLFAYAFVLVCEQHRLLTRADRAMAVVSLFLIGNVVPKSFIVSAMGLGRINERLMSAPHLADHQMYTFYGFPGVGVVLLAIVVLRLQWSLVSDTAARPGSDGLQTARS